MVSGEIVATISPRTQAVSSDLDDPLPRWVKDMQTQNSKSKHRDKHTHVPIFLACVARTVGKTELENTPKAIAARAKEWKNLSNKKTWNFRTAKRVVNG